MLKVFITLSPLVAVAGAASVAVAGAGAVAVAGADPDAASAFLLFLSILPLLNGLADYVSVAATRLFLRHLINKRPGIALILWHLILDLGVAAVCLGALLTSFILILEIITRLPWDILVFDYRLYWQELRDNPRQGTMLYGMLITTLVPTFIHLLAGLAGFWAQKSEAFKRAANALQDAGGDRISVAEINDITRDIRTGHYWGWFGAFLSTVCFGALLVAIWYALT